MLVINMVGSAVLTDNTSNITDHLSRVKTHSEVHNHNTRAEMAIILPGRRLALIEKKTFVIGVKLIDAT